MADLSHKKSHPIFDVESEIVRAGNQPSPVDLQSWQDRIDRTAGKTLDNLSRLRIVWGQDTQKGTMFVCGRMRQKYCFWRFKEAGEIRDIGVPRFYVEQLVPKETLKKDGSWDRGRGYRDPLTGKFVDVLGPIPETGFYVALFTVAFHDELCCNGSGLQRVRRDTGGFEDRLCLGAYRPPADSDLQRIRRMLWGRNNASNQEIAPSETLLSKWSDERADRIDRIEDARFEEYMDDFTKSHAWRWSVDDPTSLSHGKFHWMSGHSRSGQKLDPAQATGFRVIDRRANNEEEKYVSIDNDARSAA